MIVQVSEPFQHLIANGLYLTFLKSLFQLYQHVVKSTTCSRGCKEEERKTGAGREAKGGKQRLRRDGVNRKCVCKGASDRGVRHHV